MIRKVKIGYLYSFLGIESFIYGDGSIAGE